MKLRVNKSRRNITRECGGAIEEKEDD